MKRFQEPNPNDFDFLDTVLDRIEVDYRQKPELIMTGVEARPLITENNSGWAGTRRIALHIYRTGSVYHALAYNGSLVQAYPLFKSVLDNSEQACFDDLFNRCEYQKAVDFLIKNTF